MIHFVYRWKSNLKTSRSQTSHTASGVTIGSRHLSPQSTNGESQLSLFSCQGRGVSGAGLGAGLGFHLRVRLVSKSIGLCRHDLHRRRTSEWPSLPSSALPIWLFFSMLLAKCAGGDSYPWKSTTARFFVAVSPLVLLHKLKTFRKTEGKTKTNPKKQNCLAILQTVWSSDGDNDVFLSHFKDPIPPLRSLRNT